MAKNKPGQIWIDADACPKSVKETVFKAVYRLNIPLKLVANTYQSIPHGEHIRLIIVDKGQDVADQYIIDHVNPHDLVVTADIPLAARVVEKGCIAINPRGEIYTEENVGEALSLRDFFKELRDGGSITGGPAAFGPKDLNLFANALNKLLG